MRQLSAFKPTGHLHLGNLVGAIAPAVSAAPHNDTVIIIADLHALTVNHDPVQVGHLTMEVATLLLACGVGPATCTCYVQSHLAEHSELHYLLECATSYGEAHRMIQFKQKAGSGQARLSLLTYPVLMAADILLHDTEAVPVGDDQRQHVELARDIAVRFNRRFAPTFVVPTAVAPQVGARVKDLSDPSAKMGKTNASDAGVLYLLDPPEVLRRKVSKAVTDGAGTVRYAPAGSPGVANLLDILAACTGTPADQLAADFRSYRQLKEAVADAVIAVVTPIQERYAELSAIPDQVTEQLADGAQRARVRAAATVGRAREALGLAAMVPPAVTPAPLSPAGAGSRSIGQN
jgi:tryptophanyl-tRNA synthetase